MSLFLLPVNWQAVFLDSSKGLTMQAFSLYKPTNNKTIPLVFDSPHSSHFFPETNGLTARKEQLLTGWDAFVDELWQPAVQHGAHLLAANFSRMYVDANRGSNDIDPALVVHPTSICKPTKYSDRGMGLIRRFALPGVEMYNRKLTMQEIQTRIDTYHQPYHLALENLLNNLFQEYGCVYHIDCHSMKSQGNQMNVDFGKPRPDVVLGDNLGACACPEFVDVVESAFVKRGYSVVKNDPYKGGYLITHYGDKAQQRHSMQIELNRALYMDEKAFKPNKNFEMLKADLNEISAEISMYISKKIASN